MIFVKLKGGLGNQLFQYAFGLSVAKKLGVRLALDIYDGFEGDFFQRNYMLNRLNISSKPMSIDDLKKRQILRNNKTGKILRKIARSYPRVFKYYFGEEQLFIYDQEVYAVYDNTYFDGYWQNLKYFGDLYDQLVKEFAMKVPGNNTFQRVKSDINNTNSVAIHLRFPHAYSNGRVHKRTSDIFSIVGPEYYIQAIQFLKNKEPDVEFFIFSNDVSWAQDIISKSGINIDYNFISTGDDIEDFELMKNCNHFIISNSTYSWWAAYLGGYRKKIVVSPLEWFKEIELKKDEFFPSNWILLNCK